jgi:hypothetical protein
MAPWYEGDRKLFHKERRALAADFPLLRLVVVGPGVRINNVCKLKHERAIVHGMYNLQIPDSCRQIEYGVGLVLPRNYPKRPPDMFCNDPKLPIGNIDRHIMSDGRACLGVHGEISMRWSSNSTIVDFLESFVAPFLAWQAYYDVFQKAPPWGERSHFAQGILEFYGEILGRTADSSVIGFMRLLARKNRPKGHELCPCTSGERLQSCENHRDLICTLRERVAWQEVARDLEVLERGHSEGIHN